MKKMIIFCMMIFVLIAAVSCFAAPVTNGGYTLNIPDEYKDLLVVETPENDENAMLFTVSEKESIEAAKKQGSDDNGAGWLFSIGKVTEAEGHEMLCVDMSGADIFAKDADGNYFVLYHPTDVRMVREDYSAPDVAKNWTMLNEWASTVKDSFVADNAGLTADKHGNTVLDVYLSRLMYRDNENYTVSTLEHGPMEPKGVKAADYVAPLTRGVEYVIVDEEAPDGEYVVLSFPEDDIRFDFFLSSGKENYIRQVWSNEQNEMLYKAVFADENVKATDVMHDLYNDMVLANTLGYTADDMIGTWVEKIAGRGTIEITKDEASRQYNVKIHWSASAYQMYYWEMTANVAWNGVTLNYENGKHTIITFTSETESTEEVVYENGTGSFELLSTYELVWHDDIDHAGDDTVFVNTGK